MMTLVWILLLVLFLLLKGFLLLSSYIFSDGHVSFLFSIFPFVGIMISQIFFNFSEFKSSTLYKLIFCFVFLNLIVCFSSEVLLYFLLGVESCVIFMLVLILIYAKSDDKIGGVILMYSLNILGSMPFMYFANTYNIPFTSAPYAVEYVDSLSLFFSYVLMLAAKLPMFLIHFWLTKAHVSASGSGSMILASLMLKIGAFGLFKFSVVFTSEVLNTIKTWSLTLSLLGCIFIIIVMNRSFDLKYMVACSSIVHMSLILPFLLSMSVLGSTPSVLIMVSHGLISCMVFYLATKAYESSQNRSLIFNKSFKSISTYFTIFFCFFILLNLGFPPFASFLSELWFLSCSYKYGRLVFSIFLFNLLMVGGVFIMSISHFLFGKKTVMLLGKFDLSASFYFCMAISMIAFSPVIYNYPCSLNFY